MCPNEISGFRFAQAKERSKEKHTMIPMAIGTNRYFTNYFMRTNPSIFFVRFFCLWKRKKQISAEVYDLSWEIPVFESGSMKDVKVSPGEKEEIEIELIPVK